MSQPVLISSHSQILPPVVVHGPAPARGWPWAARSWRSRHIDPPRASQSLYLYLSSCSTCKPSSQQCTRRSRGTTTAHMCLTPYVYAMRDCCNQTIPYTVLSLLLLLCLSLHQQCQLLSYCFACLGLMQLQAQLHSLVPALRQATVGDAPLAATIPVFWHVKVTAPPSLLFLLFLLLFPPPLPPALLLLVLMLVVLPPLVRRPPKVPSHHLQVSSSPLPTRGLSKPSTNE
ncbi:hypothetical protein LIA77_04082 [Sarocladium implicatum]|nr:hypothetical protein LIA77_04082 [Sarocladium implicatum]